LPQELQKITQTSAGVFSGSKEPAAARAFLDFLFTPESRQVVKRMGHEPHPEG
jgi:ABC-type molybdate transport system substrate-binding protein